MNLVPSPLQHFREKAARTAARVRAPSLREVALSPLKQPTIGWVPESDYFLVRPNSGYFSVSFLKAPRDQRANLPETPSIQGVSASVPLAPLLVGETAEDQTSAVQLIPLRRGLPAGAPTSSRGFAVPTQYDTPLLEAPRIDILLLLRGSSPRLGAEVPALLTMRDCHGLAVPSSISSDLNLLLSADRTLPTKDCLALLVGQCAVSQDLHEPLARRVRADGKVYAVECKVSLGLDKLEPPRGAFARNEVGGRQTFERADGRITSRMGVWDLLFPLLQRPVSLDLGTTIDLPSNLYPFQINGVEFLVETPFALLGDDMGTGKTVQTSVALRMLFQTGKVRTALIVSPVSVIPNWDRELAKWAGNLAVTVVRGDKTHRKTSWRQAAHVWLTTYDTLRNDLEHVLALRKGGFDLIVLDEAQRVKNWSSGVTRSVRELRANYRWGLTGTPLENSTKELWTILNVLKPDISQHRLDWSEGIQSVLRPMFLRRRKQDVLTDLPALVQNPVWLRLEDAQRGSYDQLEKQGVLALHAKGETITAQNVIVLLNKLKQVCNRCPRSGESSKLEWLRDSLDDIAAGGDKALVFSQYTDERFAGVDWLERELADFGALNYSKATSDGKRKALLTTFRDKAKHKVFLGHPKTAGLGLNELVVANYVIHFDHWWNPAVMNQATARAHRPGQTKTVFAYDLWIEDTYEEIIFKLLEQKQGLYNDVIDSLSASQPQSENLAFAIADKLFAKYGLNRIQPKTPGAVR